MVTETEAHREPERKCIYRKSMASVETEAPQGAGGKFPIENFVLREPEEKFPLKNFVLGQPEEKIAIENPVLGEPEKIFL